MIEVLAVLALLALLGGLLLSTLAGAQERAAVDRTRAELAVLGSALGRFRGQHGRWPAAGLVAHASPDPAQPLAVRHVEAALFAALSDLGPPLTVQPGTPGCYLDPWGRRYLYYPPSESGAVSWRGGAFVLFSAGPDGRAVGPDPVTGVWPADAASRAANRDNVEAGPTR